MNCQAHYMVDISKRSKRGGNAQMKDARDAACKSPLENPETCDKVGGTRESNEHEIC